ncbi:MAG: EVE domain-containing protein [Cyanobacteria bacterium]|nr:EVE domain-containing protein [Cyanobacteriota bacterium]MDW8199949.1 EVE domain-containing protein [Cyanobacteriota bacterium SKYGB_h_bin112]
MNYWLMKSEPTVYSITDLSREGCTIWDGVRNYQARNFLRQMQINDMAFFYHSNAAPPGIVGLMRVSETNVTDPTQFDPASKYYDEKSSTDSPRWQTVRVEFVEEFPTILTLETLKTMFKPDELWVVRQGNRLSVMPVETQIAEKLLTMARSSRLA